MPQDEESANQFLSRPQFYQVVLFIAVLFFTGLVIAGSMLINGYRQTAEFLSSHMVAVAFLLSIPLALLPAYRSLDDRFKKVLRQLSYSSFILMFSSFAVWVYSFYATDITPFEDMVFSLAKWIWALLGLNVVVSGIIINTRDDD